MKTTKGIDPSFLPIHIQKLNKLGKYADKTLATKKVIPEPSILKKDVKVRGIMNKTEERFFNLLEAEGYQEIKYESIKLKLASGRYYTPDFCAISPDNQTVCMFEVKGAYVRREGEAKYNHAKSEYRMFSWHWCQWKDGDWKFISS